MSQSSKLSQTSCFRQELGEICRISETSKMSKTSKTSKMSKTSKAYKTHINCCILQRAPLYVYTNLITINR